MSFACRRLPSASGFKFIETVASDFTNYNLRTRAVAAGWDEIKPLIAQVTINSGIVVSSNNTSVYAFDTGTTAFPAGSSLALNMASAYICGMGGEGGGKYAPGSNGGPALRVIASIPATVNATSATVAGGGGGGGGYSGHGGGGRTGRINTAGTYPGTFTKGGRDWGGTTGPGGDHSSAGGGGGWGSPGGLGYASGPGGAGGAAVVGDSYITWTNTGTRYGSIS